LNARVRAISLRGRHLLVLDLLAAALSFTASLALRFDAPSEDFDRYFQAYAWFLIILISARIGSFIWLRLYQRIWRYASIDEVTAIVAAAVGSSIVAYLPLFALIGTHPSVFSIGFPRSVAVIDTVLMIALAGSWRFAARVFRVGRAGPPHGRGARALVVGGGSAGQSVIRELRSNKQLGFLPVALLADDFAVGQQLMGVPVVGRIDDLAIAIGNAHAEVVLFALPSATGVVLRQLVRQAEATGARCLTMPSVAEVVAGRVTMNTLRDVDLEDLLRRAPARIDLDSVGSTFRGKVILITGAGGSIGGELARQLFRLGPRQLVLLGHGENSIYNTLTTVRSSGEVQVTPAILDIRDAERVDRLVKEVRPDVIFHAAAHKHVPLMEMFPDEAIATNVFGTRNLLTAAMRHEVDRFVLISTDKAVNPTSVMGATKRIAELLVQDAAHTSGKWYSSVRFGNVLSSRGSVVPLFRRQMAAGGPLTVTHPNATRFFMTIPEAIQLVLQAAVLAAEGDTFVLDMGEPVRIVDLASDLVRLHGLQLGKDIEIEFTGLRPGEKVTEELFFPDEHAEQTTHEAIRRVRRDGTRVMLAQASLSELASAARAGAREPMLAALQALVPEFQFVANHARETSS
jgi:FlaA1/EpsC-like NDP-sugar epimerase